MAREWLSVKVEIVHHHDEDPWPRPARVLAVGPGHTFAQLATALDTAFGRWTRVSPPEFTLASGDKPAENIDVATAVQPGDEFRYVIEDGGWVHRCTVAASLIDPRETVGELPGRPVPYDGWGDIPDPQGRQFEGDDGRQPLPPRPAEPDPMVDAEWPAVEPQRDPVELEALRIAVQLGDAGAIAAVLADRDLRPALQAVGDAVLVALDHDPERIRAVALSVAEQLRHRFWEGDDALAEEIEAVVRGQERPGDILAVDVEEVGDALDGGLMGGSSVIDLQNGDVVPLPEHDPSLLEEMGVDLEDEDRYVHIPNYGSHESWRDMADFASGIADSRLRQRLLDAIEGRGAFRRFKDAVYEAGIEEQWFLFSAERKAGRGRAWLAAEGYRARPRRYAA